MELDSKDPKDPKQEENGPAVGQEEDSVPHEPDDEDDEADKQAADSFPASDPPSY